MEGKITIDIGAYYKLLEAEAQLDVLVARGVDNWEGYTNIPSIADFETFDEWEDAVVELMEC